MEYYEKREYPDGTKYLPVNNLIQGQTYYSKNVDENQQVFFSPVTVPSMTTTPTSPAGVPVGGAQYSPASAYGTNYTPYNPQMAPQMAPQPSPLYTGAQPISENISFDEINSARALHLALTLLGIFVPLCFLIGFPFCYIRLRDLVKRCVNPLVEESFRNYIGVGWTAWVFHIAALITYCTFWIPVCDDYYFYYDSMTCYIPLGGVVSVIVMPLIALIFTIVTVILGTSLIDRMDPTKTPFQTQYPVYA